MEEQGPREIFDAVLIDEAQDFPESFYRMVYGLVREPHRIIWAYDDLQNLGDYEMRGEGDLFGFRSDGKPLVKLKNAPDKPREDIVLPICYRNPPWSLATAHALGFGVYRRDGLVQMFEEPAIWRRIGYELVDGELRSGRDVTVRRGAASFPEYFSDELEPGDGIRCVAFETEDEQYVALADEVWRNINEDELEASDILVILPDAYTSRTKGAAILKKFLAKGVRAHLAGVTTSRDQFQLTKSVAVTHVYRAKGNEAPMVYVVNADYCQTGWELAQRRNILFTAITRSRGWVRIFGKGSKMEALREELEEVRRRNFSLTFRYPTSSEIRRLRRVHRDMSEDEKRDWSEKIGNVREVLDALERGELSMDSVPEAIRERLEVGLHRRGNRA